jgi:hypothetical protein
LLVDQKSFVENEEETWMKKSLLLLLMCCVMALLSLGATLSMENPEKVLAADEAVH